MLQVDAPLGQAIGVKEAIAQDLERYGDVRVVSVTETVPEQMSMGKTVPKRIGGTYEKTDN